MHSNHTHSLLNAYSFLSLIQEDLYEEDMAKKVKATGMIAQLCRHTENFDQLLMHGTLLQVCCCVCLSCVQVYCKVSAEF